MNNKYKIKYKELLQQQNGIINLKEWIKINHYGLEINQKLKKINIINFIKHYLNNHQIH
jgi:hypothetical protein